MISRRDLVFGGACVGAAGAAYAIKPRRYVSLLGADQLAEVVPEAFGRWSGIDIQDPLALNQKGTLAGRLYNQMVTRLYTEASTGDQVVMLLAYGARQSDELQLHRPEVCYPAFGYELTRNEPKQLSLTTTASIPARRLLAETTERRESIIYWSRLGEFLPQDGAQQRDARFRTALQGIVPDGLLSRFSTSSTDTEEAWRLIESFIIGLLSAAPPRGLNVLIGGARAKAFARDGAAKA